MSRINFKKKSGFTLIEVIVSVTIFSLIIGGVVFLVADIFNQSGFQSKVLDNNDQARKVASTFTNEVRAAVPSANGAFPIESAGTQQLIFYTQTATTINRTRYYLLNGKLYKGVTVPTGNPPVYNVNNEVNTVVQNAMATGVTDTIFSYYNGSGNVLTQPVNVTQIRNISISIKVYLQGSRNNINTYTVTSSGTIRNLKDNL